MESLAFLHLALAHETPASPDYLAEISTWEWTKLGERLNQHKVSTTINLLAATVALGIVGMARQASAMVQQGDRGSQVTALQQRLLELGYFKADVTGYFGSVTKEAVTQFQEAKGLTPDGIVGTQTQTLLSEQPVRESAKSILQLGDRGSQITALQKRLAAAGFSASDSGIFNQETEDAVRQFQQAKSLTVDGIVGEQTLAALPEITPSQPKVAPQKARSFFENKSAPLTPFIRNPD
jgi:peptidoglycan hydrolase-like protein with peptidoglycan-binding domain